MLVDWWTIIAQVVNFVVLVVLLKVFLYDRVVKAMDEREQRIAARLQEADQKRKDAEQEKQEFAQKNKDLDAKREELLQNARDDAEARRKELTEHARREADSLRRRWQESIRRNRGQFLHELREQTGRQVCEVSRRALADLAGADLEKEVVDLFLQRLDRLDDDERRALEASLAADGRPEVFSAHEMPSSRQDSVREALARISGNSLEPQFAQDPELICGVEVRARGYAVGWSIRRYLDEVSELFDAMLRQEEGEDAAAAGGSQKPQEGAS